MALSAAELLETDMKGVEAYFWDSSSGLPPDVSFVPPMQRRRLTPVERAAAAVARHAWRDGEPVPLVFASRWGEIGTTLKLIRQMHEEGEMSPAGFSSSVHNAFPGAFSLLKGSRAPYTAIAARGESLYAGAIEALAQLYDAVSRGTWNAVVLVYAEEATPEMYKPSFPDPAGSRALAARIGSEALEAGLKSGIASAAKGGFGDFVSFTGAVQCA